ncbi:MAG: YkgJ family cysteine cluster protein [Candidatus Omnitrophota bacterium]
MYRHRSKILPNLKACPACRVGSCCSEGTELTKKEILRIVKFNPGVAKPWFRLVKDHEEPDGIHHFSTIIRNRRCVFQNEDNLCIVYAARPHFCREFPLENGREAPYYKRLCALFGKERRDGHSLNSR